jgi:chemotaxis protein methyltransferase CheR
LKETNVVDIELKLLIEGLYLKYNYDFRHYSLASVRRRVEAIMNRYGFVTISLVQDRILRDTDFFMACLQFLTVNTTEMFRDPHYFLAIREKIVPHLSTYPSLKFWIAGCSTGEEVYSLAILLEEEGLLGRSLIYATDINPMNLKNAAQGIYSVDQIKKFTGNYQKAGGKKSLADYYTAAYNSVEMSPHLRKNVVFADHSLATDSVFCEVQMVSCRNVLIYFDKELQDRSFELFHDSLSHHGFLGLGEKESLRFSKNAEQFEPFSALDKIYRKKT